MTSSALLNGKRGVVLGVANQKSIAWSCALQAAQQGAQLAFNYLGPAQEKRVRELVGQAGLNSPMFPCDLGQDTEIESFFSQISKIWDNIDFIIHSVAFTEKDCLKNPFIQTSRENFLKTMDISAYSLVSVCQYAQPLLKSGSSVVCMTYYGAEKVVPHYNVVGVAKAALEACTRYLAHDLGPKGIRVNAVSAGPIKTLSASAIPGFKSMLENGQRGSPLKRNVTSEDIAQSTLYLISHLSSGVTAEVHHVDCGYHSVGAFLSEESSSGEPC
jgi:enoyl-[acyl-carrier protein] reductase I